MKATTTDDPRVVLLQARIEQLEDALGAAYQLAGEVGAPVRVLDYFHAAASGAPLPASFLPITADDCREVASARMTLAQVLDLVEPYMRKRLAGRAGAATSERKTASSRANGRKGGRPRKTAH